MTRILSSKRSDRITLNVVLFIILCSSLFTWLSLVSAIPNVPYTLDVRWTHLEKNGVPVKIGFEEIPLGSDWTYECMLTRDTKYHIYCIGNWTNIEEPDTDYDIYVYDEYADLISTHTQSAGLSEQVSNDENYWYFSPEETGYYSFQIKNDAKESQNSMNATFMIIQHVDPNTIYRKNMMGRDSHDNPVLLTSIAYEFNVTVDQFEVIVEVPSTLDMYELRIYPMANLNKEIGEAINGVLVPWEPGLHGELTEGFGGFNTVDEGYRASDAFASCESLGQDMTLIYNNTGNTLYHLVLIAEHGNGKVNFYVKTDFDHPDLQLVDPPEKVSYGEYTPITVSVKDESTLKSLYIEFTDDGGNTWQDRNMTLESGNIYKTNLPPFSSGEYVEYKVVAVDEVNNKAEVDGGFQLFEERPPSTTISCSLDKQEIKQNEAIEVTGEVTPQVAGIQVNVKFVSSSTSHVETFDTDSSGAFSCSYTPSEADTWSVLAEVVGSESFEPSQSTLIEFEVTALSLIDKIQLMIGGTFLLLTKPPYLYVVYGATSLVAAFTVYKVSGIIRERTKNSSQSE